MLRLFIGLPLPVRIRQRILARMGGVPGVRWQADDQLHLTVRFLGNIEAHQASDVDLAMRTVALQPFDIALSGTGLFGTLAKPRTIWAGVKPARSLLALENKIDALVTRAGLPPETRKYTPHITIARCNRKAARIDQYLDETGDLTSDPWTVDHFVMFRSYLGHKAAHYEIIAQYPGSPIA
ncbi:MAG: RNA 2',3'-cyclic phosphodiesterase [Alphaproteobacteria bacterium]|nr:MAG: RNA 2',3'-cyclic phosphodiesterase [Alphaproteobacteria bacterium]